MEYWSIEIINIFNITPFTQHSITPLFCATGGTAGGGAGSARGGSSAFELSAAGKGESGQHSIDLFTFAFGAGDLFRRIENQFLKFVVTVGTMIFVNRHLKDSLSHTS